MSAQALAPKAAERLAKIAGLLGSDQPGEVCNAASAGTRLLRDHGWTWETFILRRVEAPTADPAPAPPPQSGWRGAVAACQARPELLTRWERGFLEGLRQRRRLTAKQATILARLVQRVAP
ncbi:MAG: hypothetical protein EON47_06010 [Acetobacteraceae bacterium]|nr:MAG: hypothetical protein EON47_06010 [Acetobacteraceae bacterium]